MLKESGDNKVAHITFFGGETLLNFPVLQTTIAYARQRARGGRQGRRLQPDDQRDAAQAGDHRVPRREPASASRSRSTARARCRTSSASSTTAPAATTSSRRRSRSCSQRHRSRPIGARVTLTSGNARHHADLPPPHRGDGVLGSRLRAGDDLADARLRDWRAAASTRCSAQFRELAVRVPRGGGRRTGITASRTSRRRSRRFTRA